MMKKVNRYLAMLLIGAGVFMVSCQDKHEAKLEKVGTVTEKIYEDKNLSQEDYAVTLEYMEEGYSKILQILEKRDSMSPGEFATAIRELSDNYPYGEELQSFYNMKPEDLDPENQARYDKMLKARDRVLQLLPQQPQTRMYQRRPR